MLKNHMSTCKKTHVNMQHLFLILARFPWLLPVRNSFASYGASAVTRTSDRGTCGRSGPVESNHVEPVTQDLGNQVIEVVGSKETFLPLNVHPVFSF